MLAASPGFTTVAVLSLAIGIGANCAIFSFADALLLRPLPVARPGEVLAAGSAPIGAPARLEPRQRRDALRAQPSAGRRSSDRPPCPYRKTAPGDRVRTDGSETVRTHPQGTRIAGSP
jgi:hypothetical protein